MTKLLTWMCPQPPPQERPAALNDPFHSGGPPPLARLAARRLMNALRAGQIAPGLPTQVLHGKDGGKMFGVLVVEAPDGRLGFLKAFSGQLERKWDVEGFVPPVFDRAKREATEPRGEAAVRAMTARVIAAKASPAWLERRAAKAALEARHLEEQQTLALRHDARRQARRVERSALVSGAIAAQRELDWQSRADEMERRREKARQRLERAAIDEELRRFERRLQALKRLRRAVSRLASWELYDTYAFENTLGRRVSLRDLFAPLAPPSGAGDCAAPKLLIFARRQSLRPLALAEFWWGAPSRGEGRAEGVFFPACREKCGRLLPFLLQGLAVGP